jgi:hypothetical protein
MNVTATKIEVAYWIDHRCNSFLRMSDRVSRCANRPDYSPTAAFPFWKLSEF